MRRRKTEQRPAMGERTKENGKLIKNCSKAKKVDMDALHFNK